jgi:hypothetical protein
MMFTFKLSNKSQITIAANSIIEAFEAVKKQYPQYQISLIEQSRRVSEQKALKDV